jgi:AcrR family transcriptional regulator
MRVPRVVLQPDQRRAELIAVARRLFTEQGVEETSVSDIVKAAGVAQGTFYWYFKSKDDALNAVIRDITGEICGDITAVARKSGLPAHEKLTRMARLLGEAVRAQEGPLAHFHRDEHQRLHDEMSRSVTATMAPVIADVIRQGIAEGVFTTAYPDEAAIMTLACAVPLGVDWPSRGVADVSAMLVAVLDFVMKGLGYTGRQG